MTFIDLPEDVVHEALCLCDIASVLSISETNRYLHHLVASAPTIWRALVEDLRHRGFIDRLTATDIRSRSAQSLVAVVRRLVVGPEAWSPPRLQSTPPTPFSRIFGKSSRPRGEPAPLGPDSSFAQPCAHIVLNPMPHPLYPLRVFPGGKYALFRSADDPKILKSWRTADNSLLSTYRSTIPSSSIVDFAAEVLHGGERANIVIRLRGSSNLGYFSSSAFVEVISWDFVTGTTNLLSVTQYTASNFEPHSLPKICGGLALIRPYQQSWGPEIYDIIDFREQRHCKILCPSQIRSNFAMELVPGYLILTSISLSEKTQYIRVCSIDSLSDSWTPLADHNTAKPVRVSAIPHVALTTIELKGAPDRSGGIAVHESPLQRGTYRVWLYIQYSETRLLRSTTDRALLYRFRLTLPAAGQFTWREQRCTPVEPAPRSGGISYSGHTAKPDWSTGPLVSILPPEIPPAPIVVGTSHPVEALWGNVAPYSGALTYSKGHSFVLCYFE
ncbi:hypothetical protein C8R44DRAFT_985435 [Mycena epipterygia]|nr:hypothetical protein C8R44DRAFT_985435 [Mycena epipterygia]